MEFDYRRYRVPVGGSFELASIQTDDDQGCGKKKSRKQHAENLDELVGLQERLYSEKQQSLLLVLQAMDAGGKDSTIRKIAGVLNPQGCHVTGFKSPSSEERAHDFLWRVHEHAPPKGHIGIFNRSHYEDVLIVRVHQWAPSQVIERRYGHINDFERLLGDNGVRVVKVMLYISKDYQLERFRRRLTNPEKHWKFNPGDIDERKLWDDYMQAFETALNKCSTAHAPWYVVPAEKRWFRDMVVSQILVDALREMNPQFPEPDYDPVDYPPESLR